MKSGNFSQSMVSAIPADLASEEAQFYRQTLQRFPEEAVYIYSFVRNRMVYADGWEEVLGYKDDEINLLELVSITCADYAPFSHELNDKALLFIMSQTEELEKYSFTIELKKKHKNGSEVPLIVKVGVFRSQEGKVTEIIGRNMINKSIALGTVMRYAAYGPEKAAFEEELNKGLFKHFAISNKEKDVLALVAKGYSIKEIAHLQGVSKSAIEKRLFPMYKRFNVKSLPHLITFAHQNHILP